MTQEGQVTPPPVIWAQRSNLLFVTICLEDCADPTIKVEADKVYFKGVGGTEKKLHEVIINLYKEIDPDKTVQSPKGRNFELVLYKKESGPFWPRLTQENKKFHWLKSDFNKWQDEDESDEEAGNMNSNSLEEMMRQMGGLGGEGSGFGGEGTGIGGEYNIDKPNFDDLDMGGEDGPDSDDDEMPDLE
ncbi:prostaglandin E synthase 3 [Phymastichus coffea]|uniref:prostaglandin E synthase 3 n=1 Tax=Phymastichus coffea TaxID=108790 RepID=UPI00273A9DF8|nr:prostaglandin E synthase 3 [Phymastichus coffea]